MSTLAPTPAVTDLFGRAGRHWLSGRPLPVDEAVTVRARLRQMDSRGDELAIVDRGLAVEAVSDPLVAGLMGVPGVDAIAAISIAAAAGSGVG